MKYPEFKEKLKADDASIKLLKAEELLLILLELMVVRDGG